MAPGSALRICSRCFVTRSKGKALPAGLAKRLECTYTVTFSGKSDPREVAKEYAKLPDVEYAEPDYIRRALRVDPNDPYWLSNNSWGQNYRDQWDLEMMKCPDAWDTETGDASVIIAVIDTGIDYHHADIAANMWHNPGEIPGNGLDDDSNGHIDDIYGYDFAYKRQQPDGRQRPRHARCRDHRSRREQRPRYHRRELGLPTDGGEGSRRFRLGI